MKEFVPPKKQCRTCLRKRAYSSRGFAEKVAVKRWKRSGFLLTVYRCEFCQQFHLSRFPAQKKA